PDDPGRRTERRPGTGRRRSSGGDRREWPNRVGGRSRAAPHRPSTDERPRRPVGRRTDWRKRTMPERPKRGNYLIDGGIVVTVDPELGILDPGQVLVQDGEIVAVGRDLEADGAEAIDARRMIVMPGLIESHWHMWSSLGRNFISDGYEYFPAKWDTCAHYDAEGVSRSVPLGALEAVNAGTTTMHNWSHNHRTPGHADAELRAHRESMVRARYSYGHRDMLPVDEDLDFTDIDG